MNAEAIFLEIVMELNKARAKFPTWPTDALHAFGVVNEEAGELQKEVMQMTYEPHKTDLEAVRKEAIQLAAMAFRFIASIDRYTFTPAENHEQ